MAVITVTTLDDSNAVDSQVSLREALQAAATDLSVDGSVAGSGADTIVFAVGLLGGTLTLSSGALSINTGFVTINGDVNGDGVADITVSGNNLYKVFLINSFLTNATLQSLIIRDGTDSGTGGNIEIRLQTH